MKGRDWEVGVRRAHRRYELGWDVRLPGLRHVRAWRDLRLPRERPWDQRAGWSGLGTVLRMLACSGLG